MNAVIHSKPKIVPWPSVGRWPSGEITPALGNLQSVWICREMSRWDFSLRAGEGVLALVHVWEQVRPPPAAAARSPPYSQELFGKFKLVLSKTILSLVV